MTPLTADAACAIVRAGGVIAYPTEAVFGLGCDPGCEDAVMRLLAIKQRPVDKGLILVAATFGQLLPWIQPLSNVQLELVSTHWPGPVTFIVPAAERTPKWLTGNHTGLAVRISAHAGVRVLCETCGQALVSTSANLSGEPPIRDAAEFLTGQGERIARAIDGVVEGHVGQDTTPSRIVDLLTGERLR